MLAEIRNWLGLDSGLPKLPPPLSEVESYDLGVPCGANRQMIPSWIEAGRHPEVTHLIVMRDPFGNVDFPYYSTAGEGAESEVAELNGDNGVNVVAVYNYREDLNLQETRNWRFNY